MGLPSSMRAVVWHGPGDLRVEDRPLPRLTPGTSLVAVTAAGMCATDRDLTAGRLPDPAPGLIPGHEITGIVVAGEERPGIRLGDRVVVDTVYSCGICATCSAADPSACTSPGELGFTADGGWAQYIRVHTTRLHRVPESLPPTEAAIAEPFAMPLGALLDANAAIANARVLVVGGGMAAIAFASAAFALGARRVDVCLRTQRRADLFRAIHPDIHLTTAGAIEAGSADISIDSVGTSASLRTAVAGVRSRGLIICYGFTDETVRDFPIADFVMRNLRMSGHTNPKDVWPTLVDMLDRRVLATAGLVDRVITIDEVPGVVADWSDNLRTVIEFGSAT